MADPVSQPTPAELLGPAGIERFWSKVTRHPTGCWPWAGSRCGDYGAFSFQGHLYGAHRIAWAIAHNTAQVPGFVCHDCDNPICVRPDHLYLGDAATNAADRVRRGRQKTGRKKQRGEFPLYRHATGQWCKKYKGRTYYFGADRDQALKRYTAEWDAIRDGIPWASTAPEPDAVTIRDLINTFLTAKRDRVRSKEMAAESWSNYYRMAERVIGVLGRDRRVVGLGPTDFGRLRAAAAEELGPNSLTLFVSLARVMFRFGAELAGEPPRYGGQFDPPSQRVRRVHRDARGKRLIPAADLRTLIGAARPDLRAQILLGLNCGFGATDCSDLTDQALSQRPGWVVMPRKKTGIPRWAPLWPETVRAIEEARATRPAPLDRDAHAARVFLTPHGHPLVRYVQRQEDKPGVGIDAVAKNWKNLCKRCGVAAPGLFYTLRHIFRTVADETRDRPALDILMGHADDSMAAHYREEVADDRLRDVVEHVRKWLFKERAGPKRQKT